MSEAGPKLDRMGLIQRGIFQNPITLKELRSRMRGRRAYAILSLYLLAVSTIIFFIYLVFALDNSTAASAGQFAGQAIFLTMVAIQMFLVVFVAPAFTSGAITGEKERQTFELLRTTLMSPRRFVLGKVISALGYVILLIVSTIPLIFLAFMIGGVSWIEIVVSQLMLIAGAFTYSLLGLYFSSRAKTTLAATVTTYIVTIVVLVALPLLTLLGGLILAPIFAVMTTTPAWLEPLGAYGLFFGLMTNLPGSMLYSELVFMDNNSIWGYWSTGASSFFAPNSWYGTLIFHLLVARWLFRWSVSRVAKIAE